MTISLRDYHKGKTLKKNDVAVMHLDQLEKFNGDDFKFIKDVMIDYGFEISQDLVRVKLSIDTDLEFICSRCLRNFIHNVNLVCDDEILLSNLDEDIILDSDENLDFTEYVKNCIIISIPQKKLCNTDCLGLCHKCGIDLNFDKCDCDEYQFDNVFSQLRETFGDLKEEVE